mmetsp:Transcript_76749/g.217075  ORF Transcript_76749/g.217075 Transcript_76749/m.217075 type:complete len:440 (-) Transcript_76749:122-1441(-)
MTDDFKDVSKAGDGSVLLKIISRGEAGPCPGELATCRAHYRLVQDTKKGEKLTGSSKAVRELVPTNWRRGPSIVEDYMVADWEFKTIVNQDAAPKRFVVGEGEVPECIEFVARRLGAGGSAVLKLAEGALPEGRPAGPLTAEVELLGWEEPCRGPCDPRWAGIRNVFDERMIAEDFLQTAATGCSRLEALDRMKADWMRDIISDQSKEVAANSARAARRFRRAAQWLEDGQLGCESTAVEAERVRVLIGLARSLILQEKDFFPTPSAAPPVKKLSLLQAKSVAQKACQLDPRSPEAKAAAAFAHAELGQFQAAREFAGAALELDPQNAAAKNELARVSLMMKHSELQAGEAALFGSKEKLGEVFRKGDAAQSKRLMEEIKDLITAGSVSWGACMQSKLGKMVDDIRKNPPKGDKEVAKAAEEMIGKLMELTDRKCRQWI